MLFDAIQFKLSGFLNTIKMAGATCKSACCGDTQPRVEGLPATCDKESPDITIDCCSTPKADNEALEVRGGSCCSGETVKCGPTSDSKANAKETGCCAPEPAALMNDGGDGCCSGETGKCSAVSDPKPNTKETSCCASELVVPINDGGDGCCEPSKTVDKCSETNDSKTDDLDQCPDPCCKGEGVKDDAVSVTPVCCEGKPSPCCNGETK